MSPFLQPLRRCWLLTLLLICTACGSSPASNTVPTAASLQAAATAAPTAAPVQARYRIAVVTKTLSNEFFLIMKQGYEAAGERYGVEVTIVPAASEKDTQGQLDGLNKLVAAGVDALIVTPLNSDNLTPGLAEATRKGIPIINVDELIPDDVAKLGGFTISSKIASDNTDAGVQAAKHMVEKLPVGSAVAVVEGKKGVTSGTQRRDGFVAAAEAGGLKIVASTPADWDRAKAREVVAALLEAHPELKAIYFANDTMALGGIDAVEAAGKSGQLLLIGTDAIPEALQAIKQGQLTGTVAQFPYELGMLGVETAVKVLDKRPVTSIVPSPVKLVLKDSL